MSSIDSLDSLRRGLTLAWSSRLLGHGPVGWMTFEALVDFDRNKRLSKS